MSLMIAQLVSSPLDGVKVLTVTIPTPHQGQKQALQQFKRFTVLANGRRWGKSLLCQRETALAALQGLQVAYIAPNYPMVSTWWKEMVHRLGMVCTSISTVHHKMYLYGGGSISCYSMDAPNSIRGNSYDVVWIDEAAFCANLLDTWSNVIRPTLMDRAGSARFISSPNGFNDFYTLSQMANTNDDWVSISMPSWSNPYLPSAEVESMKQQLPSWVFDAEIGARFVEMKTGIFRRDWIKYIDEDALPKELNIYMGVDLAISKSTHADYTCICTIGHDPNSNSYFILDLYRNKMSMKETQGAIIRLADKYKPISIAIETVAYQKAIVDELIENTNLPVVGVTPKGDKVQRANPLAARFEKGDIYILNNSAVDKEFVNELLAFPSTKAHDDTVDSAAMALQAAQGNQTIFAFSI